MSDELPRNEPAPPDDLTDVDLYCLRCGYNLRGLSGDPRRCPECGNPNSVSRSTMPESLVGAELRRMAKSWEMSLMSWSLAGALLSAGGSVVVLVEDEGPDAILLVAVLAVAAVLSFRVWTLCLDNLRSCCGGRPGWRGLAAKYNALKLTVLGLGLGLAVAAGPPTLKYTRWNLFAREITGLIELAVFVVVVRIGNGLVNRCLRHSREQLERDTARDKAGRSLWNCLRRRPTKPFLSRWLFGG
jgi:hypothetical protein